MTTINDVLAAVKALFETKYPGETVYTNYVPQNFKRPSFLVENLPMTVSPSTVGAVTMTLQVRITAFVEVDARHESQLESLNMRQYAALGLFALWYLKVGDRALHVTALKGEAVERDYATVLVTLQWDEDLSEFAEIKELPTIENVLIRLE